MHTPTRWRRYRHLHAHLRSHLRARHRCSSHLQSPVPPTTPSPPYPSHHSSSQFPHPRPPDLSLTTTHRFHPPPHLLPPTPRSPATLADGSLAKSGDIGKSTQWIQRFTGGRAKAIGVQTKAIPEPMKFGIAAGSGQAVVKTYGATGAQIQQLCCRRLALEFAGQPNEDPRAVTWCGVAKKQLRLAIWHKK